MDELIIELDLASYQGALRERNLVAPKDSVVLDLYGGHDFCGMNVLQVNKVFARFLDFHGIPYHVRQSTERSDRNCA